MRRANAYLLVSVVGIHRILENSCRFVCIPLVPSQFVLLIKNKLISRQLGFKLTFGYVATQRQWYIQPSITVFLARLHAYTCL